MPRNAIVNYHKYKPFRQAFEIDAGGVVGRLISPELEPTSVPICDVRLGEAEATFARDGVEFTHSPSQVTRFEDGGDWAEPYDAEIFDLLKRQVDAKDVVVFDHTVRTDDPNSDRRPARNVHSDYSAKGAHQRLIDLLGNEVALEWSQGHYAFVNVWRPVEMTVLTAPLAFALPSSVAEADWITLDLIYPDRKGQIMGLAHNTEHRWIYHSQMTPDDVVFFNIYDNRGQSSVPHSAVDLVEDGGEGQVRKSIESRTLLRF